MHPAYRRRGVAGSLLAKLIEEGRRSGYRYLYADTLPAMAAALDLYRGAGFVETGPYSGRSNSRCDLSASGFVKEW